MELLMAMSSKAQLVEDSCKVKHQADKTKHLEFFMHICQWTATLDARYVSVLASYVKTQLG